MRFNASILRNCRRPMHIALLLLVTTTAFASFPEILLTAVRVGHSGETVSVPTYMINHHPISAFSYGLEHNPSLLGLIEIVPGYSVENANGGAGPDLFLVNISFPGGGTIDCIISDDGSDALPGFSGPKQLTKFRYQLAPTGPNGFTPIHFTDELGSPPVPIEVTIPGTPDETDTPFAVGGGVVYLNTGSPLGAVGEQSWFLNGGDGTISIVSLDGTLLGTLNVSGQSGPAGVAVDPAGVTWVTFRDSDSVVRFASSGSVIDVIPVGDGPTGVAIDTAGCAWVANTIAGTLTKIASDGQVLFGGVAATPSAGTQGGAIPVPAGPTGVGIDLLDNVIVACSAAGIAQKRNSDGSLVWSKLFAPGSAPTGIAVDRDSYVWVTDPALGSVSRLSSDGATSTAVGLPFGTGPVAIAIRGRAVAWVAGEGDGTLTRIAPGAPPTSFSIGGTPSGISVDGRGELWVTDRTGGTVSRYGPDGILLQAISIGSEPGFLGDAFGMVPANVLHPAADFDTDAFRNDLEIDEFTNPYDVVETPLLLPEFVEPVADLACFAIVQDVSLFWTNPDPSPFVEIRILRDGVVTEILAPTAEAFGEQLPLPIGTYQYQVVGVDLDGDESSAETCTAVIGPGNLQGTHLIEIPGLAVNLFGIAAVPGAEEGAAAFYITDPGNDQIYVVDAEFTVLEEIISPLAGIAPTTGIAYDPEGNDGLGSLIICAGATGDPDQDATIVELALDGTQLGDTYVLVRPAAGPGIGELPIKGGLTGVARSAGSDIFLAVSPVNCELFAFRVTVGGTEGLLPPVPIEIFPAASALHPAPGYGLNGVYFAPYMVFGESGGQVLVSTLGPDGEFAITRVEIAAGTATIAGTSTTLAAPDGENVFGEFIVEGDRVAAIGITTGSIYELGSAFFVRGDPDGDGVIDVGNAVQTLLICFGELPIGSCVDAHDADDDGLLTIGDAIYLLMYLFNGGNAPLAPFPSAGPDTTPDGLPCL